DPRCYTSVLLKPSLVYVGAMMSSFHISSLPSSRTQEVVDRLTPFFGEHYSASVDSLAVGLSNSNPIYHFPPAVLNFKTVEEADRLPQHTLATPRIAAGVDSADQ